MTYVIAKAANEAIAKEYHAACVTLARVSGDDRGPFGLTPAHIKATAGWQAAWNNERRLFGVWRLSNMDMCKNYAAEQKAEREARRAAKLARLSA